MADPPSKLYVQTRFFVTRFVARNGKHWQGGDQVARWTAAGLLEMVWIRTRLYVKRNSISARNLERIQEPSYRPTFGARSYW